MKRITTGVCAGFALLPESSCDANLKADSISVNCLSERTVEIILFIVFFRASVTFVSGKMSSLDPLKSTRAILSALSDLSINILAPSKRFFSGS